VTSDFADDRFGTRFGLRRAFRFQFVLEIAEAGEHLFDRLVTLITVLAQSLLQNGFEFERDLWQHAGQRCWLRRQDGRDAVTRRLAMEWRDSSDHLVDYYAQAPNVRSRVDLLAARLFGG